MIAFSETRNVKGKAFREAMNIYLEAIPEAERQKVGVIEKRVATAKEQLLVGKEGNEVICMALIYPLQNTDFVLIDYLAVKKEYRQQSIGSSLIRHIQDMYWAEGKKLLGEVEDPKQGKDKQNRACRLAFYRKSGAKVLKDVPYQLPPMQGNKSIPMVLITFTQSQEDKLAGSMVRKLISQIYAQLYGRNAGDALLDTVISQVPLTVKLE